MTAQKAYLYLNGYSGLTYTDIANLTGRTLSATEQALITDLISDYEDFIARQCKRQFVIQSKDVPAVAQDYFETADAGKYRYYYFNLPIKIVTKILLDGNVIYDATQQTNQITLGVDFYVYTDYIQFVTPPQSALDNHNALEIHYTIDKFWGNDVVLGIKRSVAETFLGGQYGGKDVNQLNTSGFSVSFNNNLPVYIKSIIRNYKKIVL